ncbi:MAG: HIT family protein [Candidatus Bathyarchaeia archaeon]
MACVFCEIIDGTAVSHILYQDNDFIAILDKYPVSIGHTLVIPKRHFERVNDLSQTDFCALYARVHALNRVITSRLNASASHISINDGAAANQLVPHLHVHIIPRNVNDGAGFTARKLLRVEEMDEIRKKLQMRDLDVKV